MITEDDYTSHVPYDAYLAYVELVGEKFATIEQLEEAYAGEYPSDATFAQEFYSETCEDTDIASRWPFVYIDWDWAARDLMSDYDEENGYYFRSL